MAQIRVQSSVQSLVVVLCPCLRGVNVHKCDYDEFNFVAAKSLNKEGLNRFVQDHTTIAALNDRLVRLIELVRTNTVTAPDDTSALSLCYLKLFLFMHYVPDWPPCFLRPAGSLF